ncbi:tetratricopeptide repeat protein [Bythopirellula polymerisocia]|uniref:TPR repeat-containing protein YrrB n=1 Tax=Bythopirellula polymerisocia TaxID=2528003 RepID=A0A5C6D327_9BACT|nr:tetratricopeptide repeat protein [Bythopirellula polymerisocia]TWU30057.1 TPR repeat-containing protein YrrB [Bythopirellula polymerisocia]
MSALKYSLRMVVVVALVTLFAPAVRSQEIGARNPDAMAAYEEGMKLLEAENWDDAIAAFTTAIGIDNTFAEAFFGRGEALRNLEDYQAALDNYKQATNIDPKSAKAYNGQAICEKELGLIDLAFNDFNNAIELDRRDPEIAANLGELLVNRDPASALRVLDKAAELDPENAEVFRNRGLAHAQLRQFDEANADLAKAIELKDDDFETYAMQANIFLFQDEKELIPKAIDALTNAIKYYEPEESSDPKSYVQGYLLRSDARLKMASDEDTPEDKREELYQQVIDDADAVLSEMPDTFPSSGQALYRKGVALRMQGLYGEAIKAFTDALQQIPPGESAPYITNAYLKRGMCWFSQGENRLARGDFLLAAASDYTDPLPHLWTGYTFAEEGDYRSAIESYGEAINKNPTFSLPYVNRGLAYVALDEYQRAADNFNEAIRVEPTTSDHFAKRGYAYMLMEEYDKAFDSFNLSSLYDENNPEAFEAAAQTLRSLGRNALAEKYEQRAQELKEKPAQQLQDKTN